MLKSLTDIIVRVRYTAMAGDPAFTLKVQNLVTQRIETGAGNHE